MDIRTYERQEVEERLYSMRRSKRKRFLSNLVGIPLCLYMALTPMTNTIAHVFISGLSFANAYDVKPEYEIKERWARLGAKELSDVFSVRSVFVPGDFLRNGGDFVKLLEETKPDMLKSNDGK